MQLPDDSIIVRGGSSAPVLLDFSVYLHESGQSAIAVVCHPQLSVKELSATLPHKIIRYTTVGNIRKSGGDAMQTDGYSPYQAIIVGLKELFITPDIHEYVSETTTARIADGHPKLYADFNNIDKYGRVRLNCKKSIIDIGRYGDRIYDNASVILDDYDQIEVHGRLVWTDENVWCAIPNPGFLP